MLVLVNSSDLDFEFTFDQNESVVLDGLRSNFIKRYGEDCFLRAGKIIIIEKHFHNIIKNRYGPTLIGEHNDLLDDSMGDYLSI